MLMTKSISKYPGYQARPSRDQRVPLAISRSGKSINASTLVEFGQANSSSMGGSAAVRMGRIGHSNSVIKVSAVPLHILDMNSSRFFQAGSSGGPSAYDEIFSLNRHRPFGIEIDDICPTDSDLFEWICDHDSFLAISNLRANQEDVNADTDKECDENTRNFTCHAALIETREKKETAENESSSSEYEIGTRSINFSIGHPSIISQQAPKSAKAVE